MAKAIRHLESLRIYGSTVAAIQDKASKGHDSCGSVCVFPVRIVAILCTDGESKLLRDGEIPNCVHQPLLTRRHPGVLSFKSEASDGATLLTSPLYSGTQEFKIGNV